MPGPWSGTVTNTQEVFHRLLSQYIWYKTHRLVEELMSMDLEDSDGINSSSIESIRGFLVYVAMKYRYMNPYLKGLNLTLDIWGTYRDKDGWIFWG